MAQRSLFRYGVRVSRSGFLNPESPSRPSQAESSFGEKFEAEERTEIMYFLFYYDYYFVVVAAAFAALAIVEFLLGFGCIRLHSTSFDFIRLLL